MNTSLASLLAAAATVATLAPPASAASYDSSTVIARLAHPSARRMAAAGVAGTVGVVPGTGARLLRVNGDPAAVAARLSHTRGVRWAEPNWRMRALAAPNDARWDDLYGVRRVGAPAFWAAHALGAFPGDGGVAVGIVDTGIDSGHEDLAGKVAACGAAAEGRVNEGDCADGNGHGTHVAGTIGALANNQVGVTGVAFSSPLIVCRALDSDGSGDVADIAACVRWVRDRGAKVISMSLGGPDSRALAAAVKTAYARGGRSGSLIVAAAGNDGDGTLNYPAALPQAVSVAAIDDHDAIAPFSNANADVEVAAPGVDVLSAQAGGGYVRLSGTSMATPHASAAAALLWGADPSASASMIRKRLDEAVDDLGAPGRDSSYGFGVVNLAKAK